MQNINIIIVMIKKFLYNFNNNNIIRILILLHKPIFQFVKFTSELVNLGGRKYGGFNFIMGRVIRCIIHDMVKIMRKIVGIIMGPRSEREIVI